MRTVRAWGGVMAAVVLLAVIVAATAAAARRPAPAPAHVTAAATCATAYRPGDWPMFGRTSSRADDAPAGLTVDRVVHLRRLRIALPDAADNSPILMTGITVRGAPRDVVVLTTRYGYSLGIDAHTGHVWWLYKPPGLAKWLNTPQFQVASPVADPDRRHVYVTTPDGYVRKLDIATGHEIRSGSWPVRITLVPGLEKMEPDLTISGCDVIAGTSSYYDHPPYVGHIVAINRATGRIAHVFNTLCSDQRRLILPATCTLGGAPNWGASVWAHGAPSIDPSTGNLLFATANGDFNGRTDWGDSILEMTGDAGRLLQNFTPTNQAYLNAADVDLGSSAPAILPVMGRWHLAVEAGKEAMLRLINVRNLNGTGHAGPRLGGEYAHIGLPGPLFTQPAVYPDRTGALVVVATRFVLSAFQVSVVHGHPHIASVWQRTPGATTPVIAGGLIYAFDPVGTGVHVYALANGHYVARLPAGIGHWVSPIVAAGVVIEPEGSADDVVTNKFLDIYR